MNHPSKNSNVNVIQNPGIRPGFAPPPVVPVDSGTPSISGTGSQLKLIAEAPPVTELGMVSHKMSIITIFGHKHFKQKFHHKFDILIQQPSILVHIWNKIANFYVILLQNYQFNSNLGSNC